MEQLWSIYSKAFTTGSNLMTGINTILYILIARLLFHGAVKI